MSVMQVFDGLLCLALLAIAWSTVCARGLFRSVVLFMVFGLLMAVVWARLDAPDLALAEAVIGAGVTGALMFNACKSVAVDPVPNGKRSRAEPSPSLPRPVLAVGCGLLGVGLAWLFRSLEPAGVTAALADESMADHVLSNPVTAVLLDFRGYDTLLEMAVLLLALIAVRLLNVQGRLPDLYPVDAPRPALLDPLVAIMIPVAVLISAYLFWAGSEKPGGAFQAGSLLAAAGILLRLGGRLHPRDRQGTWLRVTLLLGLTAFCTFALTTLVGADQPMTYPHNGRYHWMLAIEGCMTISIAATLVLLFADAPGVRLRRHR